VLHLPSVWFLNIGFRFLFKQILALMSISRVKYKFFSFARGSRHDMYVDYIGQIRN